MTEFPYRIADSKTGKFVSRNSWPTRKSAEDQIAEWVARDEKGGRPDVSYLMSSIVVVKDEQPYC